MRCEDLSPRLAEVADGVVRLPVPERRHVEACLRCQAELVQYRKVLRTMHAMRTELLEPAPGLAVEVLAHIEAAGERTAVRSLLVNRRVAYFGGLAAATAAGAAGAIIVGRAHDASTWRRDPGRRGRRDVWSGARPVRGGDGQPLASDAGSDPQLA